MDEIEKPPCCDLNVLIELTDAFIYSLPSDHQVIFRSISRKAMDLPRLIGLLEQQLSTYKTSLGYRSETRLTPEHFLTDLIRHMNQVLEWKTRDNFDTSRKFLQVLGEDDSEYEGLNPDITIAEVIEIVEQLMEGYTKVLERFGVTLSDFSPGEETRGSLI